MFFLMPHNGWCYKPFIAANPNPIYKLKVGDRGLEINIELMCGEAGRFWKRYFHSVSSANDSFNMHARRPANGL
jgi:hypothetical protein